MIFTVSQIRAKGYIRTSFVEYGKVATQYFMRNAAKELNVTMDSVKAFRTGEDTWWVFLKPDYKIGFVDEPLLNF